MEKISKQALKKIRKPERKGTDYGDAVLEGSAGSWEGMVFNPMDW